MVVEQKHAAMRHAVINLFVIIFIYFLQKYKKNRFGMLFAHKFLEEISK